MCPPAGAAPAGGWRRARSPRPRLPNPACAQAGRLLGDAAAALWPCRAAPATVVTAQLRQSPCVELSCCTVCGTARASRGARAGRPPQHCDLTAGLPTCLTSRAQPGRPNRTPFLCAFCPPSPFPQRSAPLGASMPHIQPSAITVAATRARFAALQAAGALAGVTTHERPACARATQRCGGLANDARTRGAATPRGMAGESIGLQYRPCRMGLPAGASHGRWALGGRGSAWMGPTPLALLSLRSGKGKPPAEGRATAGRKGSA